MSGGVGGDVEECAGGRGNGLWTHFKLPSPSPKSFARTLILRRENSTRLAFAFLPLLVLLTVFINIFFILFKVCVCVVCVCVCVLFVTPLETNIIDLWVLPFE